MFTKGGGLWLEEMEQLDCEVLGVDWTVNLAARAPRWAAARRCRATSTRRAVRAARSRSAEARRVLEDFGTPHTGAGTGPTQIFNLGHGISQHTPPEHVQALVEAVHAHSARMRAATRGPERSASGKFPS